MAPRGKKSVAEESSDEEEAKAAMDLVSEEENDGSLSKTAGRKIAGRAAKKAGSAKTKAVMKKETGGHSSADSDASSPSSSSSSEDDDAFESPPPAAKKRKRASKVTPAPKSTTAAARVDVEGGGSAGGGGGASSSSKKPAGVERYSCEVSKSGRAQCRKCEESIAKGIIRVGVIMGEGRWGPMTAWHHLNCVAPKVDSADEIEGFDDLPEEMQTELRDRVEESAQEVDEMYQPINPDDLVRKEWTVQAPQPDALLATLLPYQKEGLGWLLSQEKGEMGGGILADEMGMGKTIQAISLILASQPKKTDVQQNTRWKELECGAAEELQTLMGTKGKLAGGAKNVFKGRGGTLVICPLIALLQWRDEIGKFVKAGTLKVAVYHGNKRADEEAMLLEADVVLTTYAVVEADFRRVISRTKVKCPDCGKRLFPDKLFYHRKYFCGESATRTSAQAKTQRKKSSGKGGDEGGGSTSTGKKKGKGSKTTVLSDNDSDDDVVEVTSNKKGKGKASAKGKSKDKAASVTVLSDDSDADASEDETLSKSKAKGKGKAPAKSKKSKVVTTVLSSDEEQVVSTKKGKGKAPATKKKTKSMTELSSDESDISDEGSKKKSKGKGKAKAGSKGKGKAKLQLTTVLSSDEDSEGDAPKKGKKNTQKSAKGKGKGKQPPTKKLKKGDGSGDDFEVGESSGEDEDWDADEPESGGGKGAGSSALHSVSWFRIILDEAHVIKDRNTATAKAVYALCSCYKLCLTGTPLQNRVSELFSVVRFLRVDPYAYYQCRAKDCDCKSLHYRFGPMRDACEKCGHTPMRHYSVFNRYVLNPISRAGYIGEGKTAFIRLKKDLLDKMMLRRTKLSRSSDIALPMRVIRVVKRKLSAKEDDFYQALYTQSQAQFDDYVSTGVILNNYAHIFDILIRLRQAVDHPYLVVHSNTQREGMSQVGSGGSSSKKPDTTDESTGEECAICSDPPENEVVAECDHSFCRACVEELIAAAEPGASLECPTCSAPLSVSLAQDANASTPGGKKKKNKKLSTCQKKSVMHKIDLARFQTSSKMEALMQELHMMQERDPAAKAIVFSQFVNMLDLIEYRLSLGGLPCVKLSGNLTVGAREKVLDGFKEDPNVKVLLISLKAGGVALNLTVANHIFLMDPWWNPSVEWQAIDRTHRIGQYKPIHAVRLIMEDTIEERILKLQEKKQLVFESTVGGDCASLARLTIDDLRFLFGGSAGH